MEYRKEHIRQLIIKVKEKSEAQDFSVRGFEEMTDALSKSGYTFDEEYLRKKLYEGETFDKLRPSKLDDLARYLGHKNYPTFVESLRVDPVLQSMVGNYYSYIRMNHEEPNLLRSPVKITWNDGHMSYHQKGARLEFHGKLRTHRGCLFVLMESEEGKSFYHVYRIGGRKAPDVLQGIFSGVSTDFEPIGGRAVLLKTQEPFENLNTGILDISKMLKSKLEEDVSLARYFEHPQENNLSIKQSANFNLSDLRRR
jgi:hypothetical protein